MQLQIAIRHRAARGFSLLEIVLVLFVLGVLAAVLTPSVRDIIEKSRREAEARSLDELANTITASFENTDLTNLNIAALPGTIAASDLPTLFPASTTTLYSTTDNAAWFVKVARLRGLTPQVGTAPAAQSELARIAFNPLGNSRLLFASPDETSRQRFLLVSLGLPRSSICAKCRHRFDALVERNRNKLLGLIFLFRVGSIAPRCDPELPMSHPPHLSLRRLH